MASLGALRCGGNHRVSHHKFDVENLVHRIVRPCSLMIPNHTNIRGTRQRGISMAMANAEFQGNIRDTRQRRLRLDSHGKHEKEESTKGVVAREKLEEWIVREIVKKLREGPLFAEVYCNEDGETSMKTENVEGENWNVVKDGWEKGETESPEGLIFVKEIIECEEEEETKTWGLMVQWKGVDGGPVCYLLKTTNVYSGLGMCCTYYCLMKVKNFWETARSQFNNCWLAQAQYQHNYHCSSSICFYDVN